MLNTCAKFMDIDQYYVRVDSEKQYFDLYQEHAWFVLTMKPLDALANLLQVFADRLTDGQTHRLAQWHYPCCTRVG